MKIVLASANAHKIKEWQATLGKFVDGVEILSLRDVGILDDIVEDGETFEENALIKAKAAAKAGYISIGEDSGLAVNALGGAPGVYSARYSGEHGNDSANNALLLENLKEKEDRSAKFVCTIACVVPGASHPCFFRGETEGVILESAAGEGGFGYDPLFYYAPAQKSFAEMSGEEKNAISHRGRAIALFAQFLKNMKE